MDLKALHTQQLLTMLEDARCFGEDGRVDAFRRKNRPQDHIGHPASNCQHYPSPHDCVSVSDIKTELATRPHVPNKKEARLIRQQRAKS